jgi:Cu(I)/Ag(I) efflux system membrane fusion protein/cobalt-zinc-cadmium efflux system membrane fusion protein
MTKFPKKARLMGFSIILVLAAVLVFAACKKSPRAQTSSGQVADASMAGAGSQQATPKPKLYRCPMHPTFTSDKPGSCGICGMDLVPVEEEETAPSAPQAQLAPKKKTMYRSTMNPNEISDKPGKDSMGMEMVPFEVEEGPGVPAVGGRAAVRISPERQQLIGVRTTIVKVQAIHRLIRAVGRVDYAEPNISLVTLKFEGWVEKLFVNSTGRPVRRGEALLEIYSPDLVSAQQEYLLALKAKDLTGGSGLTVLASAREKLKLWGIADRQVEDLERTGEIKRTLTIYAPMSGIVIEKEVLNGQKVMPGENLFKIADLSTVWVLGDIYEYELPFVKKGQEALILLSYFPGETFSGQITYVYPYLNPETRTIRVRVEVKNPELRLKPEMYANLEIHVDYGTKLAIPADAVLDAGVKNIVFVDKGDGYFEPREIKLGAKGEGVYEVLAGIAEGEKVVTSANFLIDSESSLKAALQQMAQEEPQSKPPEPKHD